MFFRTGTKNRARFMDIMSLAGMQSEALCKALPGVHALTRHDSTSAFVGRGKKHALSVLQDPKNHAAREAMGLLGCSFDVSPDLVEMVEKFVCLLYGSAEHARVDDLRYQLLCLKAAQISQLPPTRDALRKHTLRANYQAAVWRRSLEPKPVVPSPHGHGWWVKEEQIQIDWMDQQPAPAELLELVSCACRRGCTSGRCSCSKAGLPCTEACRCSSCENRTEQGAGIVGDDVGSDGEDDGVG